MGNVLLLDKTRKLQALFQENNEGKVSFDDLCLVLKNVTGSNSLIISRKGKILGDCQTGPISPIAELGSCRTGEHIASELNDRFLGVLSTKENGNLHALGFTQKESGAYHAMIVPIAFSGARLGTLFLYRKEPEYDIDEIILCEYATTLVGLEIIRAENEESTEEYRKIHAAHAAANSLSHTELEAVCLVFRELKEQEGVIVAGKLAEQEGITRSVIVTGLRKLESDGIIDTKSAGMRGTYIHLLNDAFLDELKAVHGKGQK